MKVVKNRLARILARWQLSLILVSAVKLLLTVWAPTYGDLFNWAEDDFRVATPNSIEGQGL